MIEVGKVVTKSSRRYNHSLGLSSPYASPYDNPTFVPSEWATVGVGPKGMTLTIQADESVTLIMTPKQAIELAQIMMKAAESQAEYAKARTELELEIAKLDESFKDRISGLGIDGIEEPKSKTPLKSVPEGVVIGSGPEGVIIVEAG